MYIATVHSTNSWIREHLDTFEGSLWTSCQTAGRGQAGNSWESEKGKNLLFSYLVRQPAVEVGHAFRLTMATSLAVCDTLDAELLEHCQPSIKWPNDIYVGDKKICGILIETGLVGQRIDYAIIGIGLNINQTQWLGDAPNPVSLKQVTGREEHIEEIEQRLEEALERRLAQVNEPQQLKEEYMERLYRRTGEWWWKEREVSTEPTRIVEGETKGAFRASIKDVCENGEIVLETLETLDPLETLDSLGQTKKYHFKQIQYVL